MASSWEENQMSDYLDDLKEKTRKIAKKYDEGLTLGEGPIAL